MRLSIDVEAKDFNGHQTWTMEAETPEEALQKYKNGEGEISGEEIEVTSLEEPSLKDVYEDPEKDKRTTCHDCGVKEGQIHQRGCDMERCPFCGNQLISCSCCYIKLGFDYQEPIWDRTAMSFSPESHPTNGLPKEIYENGLPDDLSEKWETMLKEKGRVPYIVYPNMCRKCGVLWPEMFSVSDEEWEKYVMIRERDKMLCRPCYDQIKEWIDNPDKEGINNEEEKSKT